MTRAYVLVSACILYRFDRSLHELSLSSREQLQNTGPFWSTSFTGVGRSIKMATIVMQWYVNKWPCILESASLGSLPFGQG